MKLQIVLTVYFLFLQLFPNILFAVPTTSYDAELVVKGWLKTNPKALGMSMGQQVRDIESFTDNDGNVIYYIVYLQTTGYVIVSANDLVEPIIGFVNSNSYDSSTENPLAELITSDLKERIASVTTKNTFNIFSTKSNLSKTDTQNKWNSYINLVSESDSFELFSNEAICDGNPSDVRVAPLLKSKWYQTNTNDPDKRSCYNYYTPQILSDGKLSWNEGNLHYGDINNYPAGCVAIAMAQLMRYYEFPKEKEPNQPDFNDPNQTVGIGEKNSNNEYFDIYRLHRFLLGGDETGGKYRWNLMTFEPNKDTAIEEIKAIGALCHDTGIATQMNYAKDGSSTNLLKAKNAFKNNFYYENAIHGYNSSLSNLLGIILPNLDAKRPVILGISGQGNAHAVVCDGYGFDAFGTFYHHLNMGWLGLDDCWYNLPIIECQDTGYNYNTIDNCVYNIFEENKGEIISGRVLNSLGEPADANVVYLEYEGIIVDSNITDENGIYAFVDVNSLTTYTIWVDNREFPRQEIITGRSQDNFSISGNIWSVDFPATRKVIYVDQTATTGQNTGLSWIDAFTDLQDALEIAALSPGQYSEIWVAAGTYKPDNEDPAKSFQLVDYVSLYGGFAGNETYREQRDPNSNITILSGDINNDNESFDNSYHVVDGSNISSATAIDGFTITGGNASGGYPESAGGGMYVKQANLIIKNCIFIDNIARYGGALFNDNSIPILTNCIFMNNRAISYIINDANSYGGGIYNLKSNPVLLDCEFNSNSAVFGGGLFNNSSSPTISDCNLTENTAEAGAGFFNDNSSPELIGCIFNVNDANLYGGGIYNHNNSYPIITCCIFNKNSAEYYGGGLYNNNSEVIGVNNIFNKNDAGWGGCIFNDQASVSFLRNCNLVNNKGGGIYNWTNSKSVLTNCIVWGNKYEQITDDSGGSEQSTITYSNIELPNNIVYPGIGNINKNPLFIEPDNDFHLKFGSPCIDAGFGDVGVTIPMMDIEDQLRFDDPATTPNTGSGIPNYIDIGAYEYTGG